MEEEKMVGISRIDSGSMHGWFVRIYRHGKVQSKYFNDRKFDGRAGAYKAAVAYRKEQAGQFADVRRPFYAKPQSHNSTGVNGVSETFQRNRKGEKIPCFDVFWAPSHGKAKHKRFYFHHYANREEALQAAIDFRKEKEAEILRNRGIDGSDK